MLGDYALFFVLICIPLLFQGRPQKLPFASHQSAVASDVLVQDLKWNPTQASVLSACLSDGSMMTLNVTDSVKMQAMLPPPSGITCSE